MTPGDDVRAVDTIEAQVICVGINWKHPVAQINSNNEVVQVRELRQAFFGDIVELVPLEFQRQVALGSVQRPGEAELPGVAPYNTPSTQPAITADTAIAEPAPPQPTPSTTVDVDPDLVEEEAVNAFADKLAGALAERGITPEVLADVSAPVEQDAVQPDGTPAQDISDTPSTEGEPQAEGAQPSVEEVLNHIKGDNLNVPDTLALAGENDPARAAIVLEAEKATGDPRKGVVEPLEAILEKATAPAE